MKSHSISLNMTRRTCNATIPHAIANNALLSSFLNTPQLLYKLTCGLQKPTNTQRQRSQRVRNHPQTKINDYPPFVLSPINISLPNSKSATLLLWAHFLHSPKKFDPVSLHTTPLPTLVSIRYDTLGRLAGNCLRTGVGGLGVNMQIFLGPQGSFAVLRFAWVA